MIPPDRRPRDGRQKAQRPLGFAPRTWLAVCGCAVWLGLTACGGPSQRPSGVIVTDRLRPPFSVAERRALVGRPLGTFACPVPIPAVRDVTVGGYYADRDASVINPEAMARYQDATKPITDYETQITTVSDAFVRSRPADLTPARCTLDWLDAWASQGALLGRVSQQGGYVRKWALSSIAASYVKLQDAEGLDPVKRQRVEGWIRQLAAETVAYYSRPTGNDVRNNHAYWAGQAAALSAVAVNDRGLLAWGVERYRLGVSQIGTDGTLPLELARKSKARHYHNFALMPLVLIAEIAAQNGMDLHGEHSGAIHRLSGVVTDSLTDPGFFERLTGERQDWVGDLTGDSLAWAEPYYTRFRDARLVPWLTRFRPLRQRWFGGDATLAYGLLQL
jgi:poly(beta-D-mannuronate) lyase